MKIIKENNVANHIDAVYVKNEIDMLWSIELGMVCDKNQTG